MSMANSKITALSNNSKNEIGIQKIKLNVYV